MRGNLLDPDLLAEEPRFDVIFCRNLLIYLDEPARARAFDNLERLLGAGGVLFVGHADNIGAMSARFRPIGTRGSFAFERWQGPSRKPAATVPKRAGAHVPRESSRPRPAPPKRHATPLSPKATAPPEPKVEAPARNVSSLLEDAAEIANRGRHAEAIVLCDQEIHRAGPSAAAFFLRAVIRQAADDRDAAQRDFEKAVYLDPLHDEALLALSLLAQRRGDQAAAAGYRRRADRAVHEKGSR